MYDTVSDICFHRCLRNEMRMVERRWRSSRRAQIDSIVPGPGNSHLHVKADPTTPVTRRTYRTRIQYPQGRIITLPVQSLVCARSEKFYSRNWQVSREFSADQAHQVYTPILPRDSTDCTNKLSFSKFSNHWHNVSHTSHTSTKG